MKNIKFLLSLFFLTFVYSVQSQVILDEIIAIVGDDMVKESDISNQILQLKQQKKAVSENEKCELLEELLVHKLLVNQARIDSVEVTDAEIDDEITRRIDIFVGEEGSISKLEEFYGKSELEIKTEWRPLVRDQFLAQRKQSEIVGDIEVTPNEVKKYYSSLNKDSLPIIPVQYEFAEIVMEPEASAEEIKYIKDKLEGIRQRAIKGENFSKLAVLYSDDTESAKLGGQLGEYMSRGELVPEFSAVAFRLKEGEISRIVKTDFGYHIIQLVELKGEKAKVKHILLRTRQTPDAMQKALESANDIHKRLTDTLDFALAAKIYSTDKTTKNNGGIYMNPYTGSSKFTSDAIEPGILYTLKELKPGEISEPFLSYNNTGRKVYKIVKLVSVTPEHKANVIDDYDQIKDLAISDKKEKALAAWVQNKIGTMYIKFRSDRYNDCKYKHNWEFE